MKLREIMRNQLNYKLVLNILKSATDKTNLIVMLNKLKKRIVKSAGLISKDENISWLKDNRSSIEDYAKKVDQELWKETKEVCNKIRDEGEKKLKTISHDLGGGGHFYLLYFLNFHRFLSCQYYLIEQGL